MGGGAWPFLVGGVICLVDSVNERDLCGELGSNLTIVFLSSPDYRLPSRGKWEAITGL